MRKEALWATASGAVAMLVLGAPSAHAEGRGDIRVTKTVVDNGTNVIVGTSKTIRFPVKMTIKDDSGVKGVSRVAAFSTRTGQGPVDWTGISCTKLSSTTSVCTATMEISPSGIKNYSSGSYDPNALAGEWQVNATVQANDGDYWISDRIALFKVKRAATLNTQATPEPVAKGGKLTIKGKLARANWKDLEYHGYTGQDVKLQFKKAGSSSYSTVRTVQTNSTGNLSTTVTASEPGTWRWYFPGTSTTMRVVATGDSVALS